MVIEKVHGLHATGLSLSERFALQASAAPVRIAARRKSRRNSALLNQNNFTDVLNQTRANNQNLINQIAKRLDQQAKRKQLRQRLGVPPGALRRFGSESSLPGLRRSNSFSNFSQLQPTFQNRINWRGSNGNLSRSASFSNLSQGSGRGRQRWGFNRRAGNRTLRGRFNGVSQGRVTRSQTANRGRGVNRGRGRGGRRGVGGGGGGGRGAGGQRGRGGGQTLRGRGRGGVRRHTRSAGPVPSKEELDNQLDEYMASSKYALDRELDAYMKSAMEMEP